LAAHEVTLPFLIVETGQPVASMRRHRGFPHWIRVAAGLEPDAAVVVDVEHGQPLPQREGFAGAIVTGSAAMVTDRHDWSERSADWLRDADIDKLKEGVEKQVKEHPARTLLVALGAGYLIGKAFRR